MPITLINASSTMKLAGGLTSTSIKLHFLIKEMTRNTNTVVSDYSISKLVETGCAHPALSWSSVCPVLECVITMSTHTHNKLIIPF